MSNSLEADQTRLFVGSDLGPNSLHSGLSADDTSRKKDLKMVFVKYIGILLMVLSVPKIIVVFREYMMKLSHGDCAYTSYE